MGLLEGKVCLITGTSRGIGLEVARRFAEEGAIVYANARKDNCIDDRSIEWTKKYDTKKDSDNLLYRIKADRLVPELMNYRGNSGMFYEYECSDISELKDFCNDTHCQTIGRFCEMERIEPLFSLGIKGVDRVVPIGHTMDFDLLWDGYNLVNQLTR